MKWLRVETSRYRVHYSFTNLFETAKRRKAMAVILGGYPTVSIGFVQIRYAIRVNIWSSFEWYTYVLAVPPEVSDDTIQR